MTIPDSFPAFLATQRDDTVDRGVASLARDDLGDGEVTVRVDWSSINYKDALATIPKGQVARISPLVRGIDLAGEVVASDSDAFSAGDEVLVTGYDLGVAHHGGWARYARVPADWVVALPDGLSPREAMALGTAGLTAGLSIHALEAHGLTPADGPVLVLGARAASAARRSARSPPPATRCGPPPARPTSTTTCAASAPTRSSRGRRRPPTRTVRWRRRAGPRPSTRSAAPPRPTPCAPHATGAPSPSAASRRAPA